LEANALHAEGDGPLRPLPYGRAKRVAFGGEQEGGRLPEVAHSHAREIEIIVQGRDFCPYRECRALLHDAAARISKILFGI
jgi:hypothetical protein